MLLAMMRRLHMSTEIIEKSAFYQEALAKGSERGSEQGKAKGIEQGNAAGLCDAIMMIVRARIGEPAPDLVQALESAQVDTLENVMAHALIETLDEVRAQLALWAKPAFAIMTVMIDGAASIVLRS
ncbi:MAG: hypothetical protein ACXWQ5_20295 [Ktedonobacterales bacterium]